MEKTLPFPLKQAIAISGIDSHDLLGKQKPQAEACRWFISVSRLPIISRTLRSFRITFNLYYLSLVRYLEILKQYLHSHKTC